MPLLAAVRDAARRAVRRMIVVAIALAVCAAAVPTALAAHRRHVTRVETQVRSASPDARLVRESYVRLYAPLRAADGSHPSACNWIGYLRFRSSRGPRMAWRADAIFVTMPGIFAGASTIDQFARNVVRTAAQRHRHVEVWALDRRSNCLEDHRGVQVAAGEHDPKLAFDYYFHGAAAGGRRFGGFASPQQARFLSGVGLAQTVRDEETVIARGVPRRLRTKKVFCGGHSLGGPLTTAFADWDFDRRRADAGYNQCAAYFALDTRLSLSVGQPSSPGALPSGVGIAQLLSPGANTGPYVDLPPFTPENTESVPLTALTAYQQGRRQSQIGNWLPDDANYQAAYRLLFSRDALDAVTQVPSWRDYRITNEAALGGIFDNNSSPIVILRASLGTFNGGPVAEKNWPAPYGQTLVPRLIDGKHLMIPSVPHGPLYGWLPYNRVGLPGAPTQLDARGQPFTTRACEATDIHQFARGIFEAPADFMEQYFPTRLLNDQQAAGDGDRSGDLRHLRYNGISKHAAFYADAGRGIEAGAVPPPNGPRPQKRIELPCYNHIDVVTASWRQNSRLHEPESAALVGWMLRVLRAEAHRRHH